MKRPLTDRRLELARQRLLNQLIASPLAGDAAAVVRHLGAVQAQEYPFARWSIGQRSLGLVERALDEALATGEIVRVHVLRDTWHIVAADDLRWLVELTRPRIRKRNETMHRRLGLEARTLAKTEALLADALTGSAGLTRAQIGSLLRGHGIHADGPYLAYILMHAELELLICSGGLSGKQQTYALVDERVAPTPAIRGDDALAELTRRFLRSHGPATVKDFAWWASLTVGDARRGIGLTAAELHGAEVDGRTYWSASARPHAHKSRPSAHLLPCYDELVVGYAESRDVIDVRALAAARPGARTRLNHLVLLDGQLVGYWRRTSARDAPAIETELLRALDAAERDAVGDAVSRYSRFVGLPPFS